MSKNTGSLIQVAVASIKLLVVHCLSEVYVYISHEDVTHRGVGVLLC